MDRQPQLADDRIELRPLAEADREEIFAIAGDRRIWEQHPMRDRWRPDVFAAFFEEALHEGGALAVIEQASGAIIGSSQYRPTGLDPVAMEIGWTFLTPSMWGTGINARMKRLMLAHALQSVPRVLFRVGDTNWRSRKAMEKIGGVLTTFKEVVIYQGQTLKHVVYSIERADFAKGPLADQA